MMISHSRLKEMLSYDPATGIFIRLIAPRTCPHLRGAQAGSNDGQDYLVVHLDGVRYKLHRLAWFYMTGEWPIDEIDHRNTDSLDNRFLNLRPATQHQNYCNRRRYVNNTSGIAGVTWNKLACKWEARIKFNRRQINLGVYDNLFDAAVARKSAANRLFGEFANQGA